MSEQAKLYIAAVGMITPIGANTAMTAAAVRAGVSGFRNTAFYLDEDDHIRMALVPRDALDISLNEDALPEDYSARQIRLLQLAALALSELRPRLPAKLKLPLFIAGPEPLIEGDPLINRAFLENLIKQTGVDLDLALSRVIATGRAGGLTAVQLAFRFLANSSENYALVGGVDTFYDGAMVQLLHKDDRLLAGGNMDGFIPGEGAGFVLLSRHPVPVNAQGDKTVCVYEPGSGSERGHRGSPEPYRGDGLADALRIALDNAQTPKIKTLYSSMNGEHFFAKEHGVAMVRNRERLEENLKVEHPADCLGDLGAAFAPVILGIAANDIPNRKLATPCAVCCSSDREPRSAVVVQG